MASVSHLRKYGAPPVVAAYMVVSVGMTIANKEAVTSLKAGTILLGIQMLATDIIILACHLLGVMQISGSFKEAIRWLPIGILSGFVLFAGMQALKFASLSTVTVVRNASPLFLLTAEWFAFGLRPTWSIVFSLGVILIGVAIYTRNELSTASASLTGILFISLDAFLVCLDGLLERYLLGIQPVGLSLAATVLISNTVGLLPLALLLLGPCSSDWQELSLSSNHGVLWALATLPGGAAISVCGIAIRVVLSATGALVVANVDKVVILLYGMLVLGDQMGGSKVVGCTLALAGGAWHAVARAQADRSSSSQVVTAPSDAGVSLIEQPPELPLS